jgi:uncharacterized membrane protein
MGRKRELRTRGIGERRDFKAVFSAYKWLLALIFVYVLTMSLVVVLRFYTFRTNAFDLGLFNQAFSTALKGKLFYETPDQFLIPSGSFLGTHFSLLMFLLLPIYALFPFPQTLLILQTAIIALAAIPIYLVAQRVLGRGKLPLLVAGLYLINPATLNMNLFDFHLEAFLPFFLGMFFYSYVVKRWKLYSFFLVLSLITVDFAAILVCVISLAHIFQGISVRSSNRWSFRFLGNKLQSVILLSTVFLSIGVFYLTIYLSGVMAGTNTSVQQILGGFVSSGSTGPDYLLLSEFWLLAFVSVVYLPLFAPRQLVMVAPWFLVTILGVSPLHYSFGYQYAGAFVVPFLILASIYGLNMLRNARLLRPLLGVAVVVCIVASPFNPLTQGRFSGIAYEQGFSLPNSHDNILDRSLNLIPSNASVLTQNSLFTQVSGREDAYVLLVDNKSSVQYVLADTTSPTYAQILWGYMAMKDYLPSFLKSSNYGVLVNDDGVILLEYGYTGPILLTGPTNYTYDFRTLSILSGTLESDPASVSGTVLVHSQSAPTGTFWFGPYASLPPGEYRVSFHLKDEPTTNGSLTLQVSNFVNMTVQEAIAQRTLTRADFPNPGSWTSISFDFMYTPQQSIQGLLEFRGINTTGGPFSLDYVEVTYLGPGSK